MDQINNQINNTKVVAAPIYLLIGCPGAGKSFVVERVKDRFEVVPRDDHLDLDDRQYARLAGRTARTATRPVLIETGYSISAVREPLLALGF